MIIDRRNGKYTLTSSFAKEVTKLRKGMGITQAELAERTGISPSIICRFEMGKAKETSAEKIETLESFFGIKFVRCDDNDEYEDEYAIRINKLENEYMARIKELEDENAVFRKLLMKYWKEEGTLC